MIMLWMGKFVPLLLVSFKSDSHFVELHHCCICTNGMARPLGSYSDQVCLRGVALFIDFVFFEQTPNSVTLYYIVSDVIIHLLICWHHVCYPAWLADLILWLWHFDRRFHWGIQVNLVALSDGSLFGRIFALLFICACFKLDCDLSVFCYHFAPGILYLAKGIGNVMRFMFDNEALVFSRVVLVVIDEVIFDLEKNFLLTFSAQAFFFSNAALCVSTQHLYTINLFL